MQKPTLCICVHARIPYIRYTRVQYNTPMSIYYCLVFEDFLLKFLRFQKVKNKR